MDIWVCNYCGWKYQHEPKDICCNCSGSKFYKRRVEPLRLPLTQPKSSCWSYRPKLRWFTWLSALLLLVGLLTSCAALTRHNRQAMVNHCKESIVFFKDAKTGLCFAAIEGIGLTTIPCDKLPKEK